MAFLTITRKRLIWTILRRIFLWGLLLRTSSTSNGGTTSANPNKGEPKGPQHREEIDITTVRWTMSQSGTQPDGRLFIGQA